MKGRRLKKMHFIEVTYSINTPMFLGSVKNKNAELRPASFNGILRYWFRALALAEFNGDMKEVERLEDIVFGNAKDKKTQKALYSIKMKNYDIPIKKKYDGNNREDRQGIVYLGYGAIIYNSKKKSSVYDRDYIIPGKNIAVVLIQNKGIKNKTSKKDLELGQELLINALKALGLFGGLGSKSRKGFGSLTLLDLKCDGESKVDAPYCGDVEGLKDEINNLLKKAKSFGKSIEDIKYTAFNKFTRIVVTKEFYDPMELLDEIGKEMIRYRSCGIRWKILSGEDSEKIFKDDHDLIYDFSRTGKINRHPRRVVFGLPHNYRLRNRKNVFINSDHRRASPLFIHVHKLSNQKYVGILTLIPSKFLKDREKIRIEQTYYEYVNSRRRRVKEYEEEVEAQVFYKVIEDFLDRVEEKLSGCKII